MWKSIPTSQCQIPTSQSFGDVFIAGKYLVNQIILTLSSQCGSSALILAAWFGYTETVIELVTAGAKLDLQNKVYLFSQIIH